MAIATKIQNGILISITIDVGGIIEKQLLRHHAGHSLKKSYINTKH
jgi:hypothetical protein